MADVEFFEQLVERAFAFLAALFDDFQNGAKTEYEVLRLGPHGAAARLSLRRSVFGDTLLPDLRVGADGKLYQLSTSPDTGITVTRFPLG